jgi:outer membrane immunogenic protein
MKRMARAAALSMTVAGCAASAAKPAAAADIPHASYYTAAAPLSAYSWTGPYLGGNLGYAWGTTSNNPTRPSGVAGGAEAGFNWQAGPIVLGGEADIQLSGANDVFAPWKFSNPWFGTVRGRAGFAVNNFLFYGTAGFAFGQLRAETVGFATESHSNVGWTAGVGAEAGFGANWSAKVEYLFVDLSGSTFALTGTNNGLTSNLFRMGVNYHF